ncbi:serine phosphatase RsbU (regulator of sigma subunit) [Arthrobacter sp. CAN_A212]|uniref:GAF domain-containing SpoIIE family protein phosphatase n=1 Tax=Arthrobacter sp. CAN_A212 TaxID=2787719 RepID=UPI0018CA4EA1
MNEPSPNLFNESAGSAHNETERLKSLAETALLDTPPEEGFDRITRLAQKLFGVSSASVSLIAEDRQFLKSVAGTLDVNSPRKASFCTHTIMTPDTLVVEDAGEDDRFSSNPYVLGIPNIRFYAGQPLQGPGGHNIGTLCISDQQPRTFNGEQEKVLRDLAAVVQREINVRTDLQNGARIQHAPSLPGYRVTAAFRPAGELSGDFYDWDLVQGRFRFTLADVMGKGTGPAILAATVRAGLRANANLDPAGAFAAVSTELTCNLERTDSFVTAFHGDLDPDTGTVSYSDAGHGLAHYLPAGGRPIRLPTSSGPLGIFPGMQWHTESLTLGPGDALMIPSDGVLELVNDDLEELAHVLAQLSSADDPRDFIDRLSSEAVTGADDTTVLILRRNELTVGLDGL